MDSVLFDRMIGRGDDRPFDDDSFDGLRGFIDRERLLNRRDRDSILDYPRVG